MTRVHLVLGLAAVIVLAHVALWLADQPIGMKVTFTAINAVGWTIVLAPILMVDRWLEAMRKRHEDRK